MVERGELPKDERGRQVSGETKESQRRDLGDWSEGATEQRPKGPTQQRREGPRGSQRERQAQEPKGSKGTDTEERVQGDHKGSGQAQEPKGSRGIKRRKPNQRGNMDQEPEAVETLPEANQRGDCVVSR